ncbi:hypothetical protein EZI54_23845 [Marinobacter halodurans]|uniref:Lipoprotein n=1 Tax=Marinobacter halodurans TaxID=2528979 RepID=A0ABY1ZFU0_9GAMM|nr:hypothetical protein [Marinobacter halodurans]TBW44116.1 hypothetical protein EZI54_23845 [Marinobacter halodurans]
MSLVTVLAGCSAGPTIPMDPYEDGLTQRCVSNLPEELQEDSDKKTDCRLSAIFNVHLASRIYETMAEEQKSECEQEYVVAKKAEACYREKQKEFFDDWMNNLHPS